MDVTITYGAGSGDHDDVINPTPIAPFNILPNLTYVATRFGNVVKIDDVRDTLPPGVGTLWIQCQQLPEKFNPNFSTERPAPVFEFLLQLDGTHGPRTVNHLYPLNVHGWEMGPRVYLTPDGQQGVPGPLLRAPLHLNVIPAPASLGLLLPLLALRRRRRQ